MKTSNILARIFCSVILLGTAVSCVDSTYDFDRTDRSVTLIGETITIPLGDTQQLTVEKLLGDRLGDYLVSLSDGTCCLQYAGKPVNFVFDELKKIDGAAPFSRFCDFPISYDFDLFTNPEKPAYDNKGEADLTGSIPEKVQLKNVSRSISTSIPNMPKELAGLNAITLTEKSRVELTLTIPDCPLISGTVTPDLNIDLGTFFESEDFPGGILKFTTPLTSKNGYTVTQSFPLHRFALQPESFNPKDHSLNVDATVKFNGSCTISQPRTDRAHHDKAPKQIQLKVTAIMRDIACQEIEGAFEYSRKNQVTFPLGDFASGITDKLNGDIVFEFLDPTILLDIESNITIPISAKMELAARQNKVKYAEVKNIPIVFPLPEPGKTASKRIRMSKDPGQNPGEDPVAVDFTQLLSRIPDDMLITANASTQSDKTAVLRIGQNYKVTVSPQVIIPLALGPDTKVEVRDTVSVPAKLGALLQENTLKVVGQMENGLPLQLSFGLVMTDADGVPLTETVHQVIAAGSTSDVSLTLTRLSGADPSRLCSAILTFEVDGIPESRPVKMDDAIRAKLHIEIPGGYHLTL